MIWLQNRFSSRTMMQTQHAMKPYSSPLLLLGRFIKQCPAETARAVTGVFSKKVERTDRREEATSIAIISKGKIDKEVIEIGDESSIV